MSAQCAGLLGWLAACDAHANDNFRSDAARVLTALGLVVADWQDEVLFDLQSNRVATLDRVWANLSRQLGARRR